MGGDQLSPTSHPSWLWDIPPLSRLPTQPPTTFTHTCKHLVCPWCHPLSYSTSSLTTSSLVLLVFNRLVIAHLREPNLIHTVQLAYSSTNSHPPTLIPTHDYPHAQIYPTIKLPVVVMVFCHVHYKQVTWHTARLGMSQTHNTVDRYGPSTSRVLSVQDFLSQ